MTNPTKARPILMSAPMVRALIAGSKTQTRRIVKPQPHHGPVGQMVNLGGANWAMDDGDMSGNWTCPYGDPGDLLIVRETFRLPAEYDDLKPTKVRSDVPIHYGADGRADEGWGKTRVSIHMPRWASRLTLEIADIWVEQLMDISEADAEAEGVTRIGKQFPSFADPSSDWHRGPNLWTVDCGDGSLNSPTASGAYKMLWELINGKDSWAENPYVWCVEFRVHYANVDQVLRETAA